MTEAEIIFAHEVLKHPIMVQFMAAGKQFDTLIRRDGYVDKNTPNALLSADTLAAKADIIRLGAELRKEVLVPFFGEP